MSAGLSYSPPRGSLFNCFQCLKLHSLTPSSIQDQRPGQLASTPPARMFSKSTTYTLPSSFVVTDNPRCSHLFRFKPHTNKSRQKTVWVISRSSFSHRLRELIIHTALPNKPKLFRQTQKFTKSSVRTGFNAVLRFPTFPERRTGLVVRFCEIIEPWTELWSGSEKFRFELWFRTGLRHP